MPDGWRPDAPPELQGERTIRLDFETTGLQWWAGDRPVGVAYFLPTSGRKGYLPFGHQGGGNLDESVVSEWARRELRGVHIDNANTKFDVHMSRAWGVDFTTLGCTFGDVAHRAALLDDHRFRFGVDQLAKDFLGEDEGKYDLGLRDKGNLWRLPAWKVQAYAIQDVELVDRLCRVMDPMLADQDLLRVHALEQDIIKVVVEMEKNGAYLDLEKLFAWQAQATAEYEEQLWRIYRDTGVMIASPDANKDIEKVFKARGIPITALTKAGRASFTGEILAEVAKTDATIAALLYAAQLGDLKSKYLDKYAATVRQSDGWIRFNLHQLRMGRDEDNKKGTVSGRFSSAGDDFGGFNVQQVVSPKKQKSKNWCTKYIIRNLFRPGSPTERAENPNLTWLAVDASQIEYRIFAHFASAEDILAAYAEDVPEDVAKREKRGRWTDYHDKVQVMLQQVKPDIERKHTKITNFCKLFGSGIIKFALTLEMINQQTFDDLTEKYDTRKWGRKPGRMAAIRSEPVLQEALSVYDAYDQRFPSAKDTLKLCSDTARDRGYVMTHLGRRARFPGKQRLHSALNRVVQGTAADINKRMLVEVYNRREELGLTLRMTVHDEVDADLKDPGLLPKIEDVFNTQYIPLKVQILWDAETGPSWGEAKGKA